MDNKEIYNKLLNIYPPECNYVVFPCDNNKCFWGKDKESNIVYMLTSTAIKLPAIYQETKSLLFAFNKKCTFVINGVSESKVMHLLICKEKESDKIEAFIRLTKAFSFNDIGNDQYYLAKLFSSLSSLFDKTQHISEVELQGLFAELYTIKYFHTLRCDILKYWQSHNKMKFDFSLDESKRLEIKSTTKPSRTHRFKHEQLLSDIYDIKIVSIMLQKNDFGLSLGTLVDEIRTLYAENYVLLLHVESIVTHIDTDSLYTIKYDRNYLEKNIKFFDAKYIPHFSEKSPEGVYNAEYDCILDNVPEISTADIENWIGGDEIVQNV